MAFKYVSYTEDKLTPFAQEVFKYPIISHALNNGGYIAGGFARAILRRDDVKLYLERRGDVDIFFRGEQHYEGARQLAHSLVYKPAQRRKKGIGRAALTMNNSPTGFCTDIRAVISGISQTRYLHRDMQKIQLINIFRGDVDDVLSTFDLENCQVAITKKHIVYSENVPKLEMLGTMNVLHGDSPLLAQRIRKYQCYRGLSSFTAGSSEAMRDWITSWRTDKWGTHPLAGKVAQPYSEVHLEQLLKESDLVPDSHLALLFGKITVARQMGSGYTTWWKKFDAATEELKRRDSLVTQL